jgi:hypothetical protein
MGHILNCFQGRQQQQIKHLRRSGASAARDVGNGMGTSPESWEKAAANAVEKAGKHLRDLRSAEISEPKRPLI